MEDKAPVIQGRSVRGGRQAERRPTVIPYLLFGKTGTQWPGKAAYSASYCKAQN